MKWRRQHHETCVICFVSHHSDCIKSKNNPSEQSGEYRLNSSSCDDISFNMTYSVVSLFVPYLVHLTGPRVSSSYSGWYSFPWLAVRRQVVLQKTWLILFSNASHPFWTSEVSLSLKQEMWIYSSAPLQRRPIFDVRESHRTFNSIGLPLS
jgi:hypothetical protein